MKSPRPPLALGIQIRLLGIEVGSEQRTFLAEEMTITRVWKQSTPLGGRRKQ
jgi:hypothetical protein